MWDSRSFFCDGRQPRGVWSWRPKKVVYSRDLDYDSEIELFSPLRMTTVLKRKIHVHGHVS